MSVFAACGCRLRHGADCRLSVEADAFDAGQDRGVEPATPRSVRRKAAVPAFSLLWVTRYLDCPAISRF